MYEIRKRTYVPIVADIHFHYKLALKSLDAGIDKLRINPGNIGHIDRVREVVRAAEAQKVPIRIGVNGGSLEKDLLKKLEKAAGFGLEFRDDPLLRPDEFKLVVKSAGRDVTQQYAVA